MLDHYHVTITAIQVHNTTRPIVNFQCLVTVSDYILLQNQLQGIVSLVAQIWSNCGDPTYFSFYSNYFTCQVSFKMPKGTYRVTSIDPGTQKFVIQIKYAGHYTNSTRILQLNKSFSFDATIDSNNYSSEVKDEIEISWEPPLEPSCNSSRDCKDWPNSTCNIVAGDGKRRCLCTRNFQWNGSNLNCTKGHNAISCASWLLQIKIILLVKNELDH